MKTVFSAQLSLAKDFSQPVLVVMVPGTTEIAIGAYDPYALNAAVALQGWDSQKANCIETPPAVRK